MLKRITLPVLFFLCLSQINTAQTWNALGKCFWGVAGSGFDNMEVYKNKLYISGYLDTSCVNPNNYKRLIIFDGQSFDTLPGGIDADVYSLTVYNDTLVLGGGFTYTGTDPWPSTSNTYGLAKWDGNNWSTGHVFYNDGVINAVAVYKGELYVGGNFTQINGQPFGRIAKWNGSQWTNVGGSFYGDNAVDCMTVFNNELYVGGHVSLPNVSNNYYNCVRWNGTKWDSVGGKFGPNWVISLCADTINNKLYIGGGITYAGTVPVWSVAQWDGTNLSSPGGFGITDGAYTMAMYNNELYVGSLAFRDTNFAKYNGNNWIPLKVNHNGGVNALGVYNGNLYAGGSFDSIGGIAAKNIACYGSTCPQGVGVQELQVSGLKFKVYPNPAKNNITIETTEDKKFVVHITNPLGQQIITQSFQKKTEVNVSSFCKGLFLVEVCDEKGVKCHTEKVLVE
ncbi:MAG: T9SS type A sorting domain-containing protein [Bacteroidetes bacterium]|nr:T9SS type A sorting domain-containing protein [Bacteroidota bacterium]